MKKKLLSLLFMGAVTIGSSMTVLAASQDSPVGDALKDNDLILKNAKNMVYTVLYDTKLEENTTKDNIIESSINGDKISDGKGSVVNSAQNPINFANNSDFVEYYDYSDATFKLPKQSDKFRTDYYTFLGWLYDDTSLNITGFTDNRSNPIDETTLEQHKDGESATFSGNEKLEASTDTANIREDMEIRNGSVGSRHYTSYWRQNVLQVKLNGNYVTNSKNEKVYAKFGKDGTYTKINGHQCYVNGTYITEDNGYKIATDGTITNTKLNNTLNIADYIEVEETSPTLLDGNYIGDDADVGFNLYLEDYHLVPGKEWIDADGNTYSQSQAPGHIFDFKANNAAGTAISDTFMTDLKNGDATVELYANWAPNDYVVTYDVGGTIEPNITNKEKVKPVWNNSSMAVNGSFNKWSSSETFTIENETKGNLPTPSRSYYDFDGWFIKDASGVNGVKDIDNDGKITDADEVKTYAELIQYTIHDNRDLELVAEWVPYTYQLSYKVGDIADTFYNEGVSTNGYIKDGDGAKVESLSSVKKNTLTEKSGLDKTFSGKSVPEFVITINAEAKGVLAETETDHFDKTNSWIYNNFKSITTYQQLIDELDDYDNGEKVELFYDRKKESNLTEYKIVYNFGTAKFTSLSADYSSGYTVNEKLSGAYWANGGSEFNSTHRKATVSLEKTGAYTTATFNPTGQSGSDVSYGKTDAIKFTLKNYNDNLPKALLNCHTMSSWKENGTNKQITKYSDFIIPNQGSQTYNVTAQWSGVSHKSEQNGKIHANPNCTLKGVSYTYCTTCGDVSSTGDISALGHKYGNWQYNANISCTASGSKYRVCVNNTSHVEKTVRGSHTGVSIKHTHADSCYGTESRQQGSKDLRNAQRNQKGSVREAREEMQSLAKTYTKNTWGPSSFVYSLATQISDGAYNDIDMGNYHLLRYQSPSYTDESGIWRVYVTVHKYSDKVAGGESFNLMLRPKSCGYTNGQHLYYKCSVCNTTY